ncbi:alpha-1A adrenergic receptor-like [Patiria miniata]|uniref:G-protein coupled receptors family 1 profile domain-containing protein n=1 Tax=Patiria miniata TaxID=46514 RepID=A0A913Z5Y1_PATMI|nr:alpha-1A adrenergic receptor-like [Patiria miniata]
MYQNKTDLNVQVKRWCFLYTLHVSLLKPCGNRKAAFPVMNQIVSGSWVSLHAIAMDNLTVDGSFSIMYSCPNDVVCLLEVVVVILVSSLILLSNTGNLVVLLSTSAFRNSHGYLLISLSVADFGVGCVATLSIYPSATLQGSTDSWPYGDAACLIAAYAGQLVLMNSGLGLMLLSIERYIAVAHPLKYARLVTKKATTIAIALCWLLTASVFSTVFADLPPHSYAPQFYVCQSLTKVPVFTLLFIFGAALPSVIVVLVTSAIVSRKLKESARLRAAFVPAITPSSASQDSNLSGGTSQKAVRLSRTIRIMTIAVILHMFPFLIVISITVLSDTKIPQVISFASYWWMIANSFVNTIIYYLKTTKFRERVNEIADKLLPHCFRKIDERLVCTCRCRKRQSSSTPSSSYETPENQNMELVAVRKDQGNGIENGGFQDSKTSLAENQTDESQTAVNRL